MDAYYQSDALTLIDETEVLYKGYLLGLNWTRQRMD